MGFSKKPPNNKHFQSNKPHELCKGPIGNQLARTIPNAEGFVHLESVKLLQRHGIPFRFIHVERPPRSAQEVEQAMGCKLEQVIKTLLFTGDKDVLVCIPGNRKVDMAKLKRLLNVSNLKMASPQEIQEKTGFVIGGVCPFVEKVKIATILDKAVLGNETVNMGAGTNTTGVELKSSDLMKIWRGTVEDIT